MATNSMNAMLVDVYTAIFVIFSLTSTDADVMPRLQMKVISKILFSRLLYTHLAIENHATRINDITMMTS